MASEVTKRIISEALIEQELVHFGEGEPCLYCDDERPHQGFLRFEDKGRFNFVGLECVPEALGYVVGRGQYVGVKSRSQDTIHAVWTGDGINPAHCPCEGFRHADRAGPVRASCAHLRGVEHALRLGLNLGQLGFDGWPGMFDEETREEVLG